MAKRGDLQALVGSPADEKARRKAQRRAERANRTAAADGEISAETQETGALATSTSPAAGLRVIEPISPGIRRAVADIRRQAPAFGFFWRRYLRKRYGRTFFGYLWLFLPVLLPLLVGALVFGGILGVDVGPVPYFLYFTIALGAWTVFSMTAYFSTRSLEISRSEIRRIYVPRLVPLISAMALPVITYLIYVVLAAGATGFYVLERGEFYLELGPETLLVPGAVVMLITLGLACGLWFSPLAPRARDVRRLAGYVLGFIYFLTPVMYPIDEIPEGYRFLASLNPVTAPIEMIKQGTMGIGEVTTLGVSVYFGALLLIASIGLLMFRAKERRDVEQCY